MTYLFKIGLALSFLFLYSCDKDSLDEKNVLLEKLIIGDWLLDGQLKWNEEDFELPPVELDLDECQMKESISFSDDFIYDRITYSGDSCKTINEYTATYTIVSEDHLQIVGGGLTIPVFIDSIDENKLIITISESLTTDIYIRQ